MTSRREFIKKTLFSAAALSAAGFDFSFARTQMPVFTSRRPAASDRKFTSAAVEETIKQVKNSIKDEELAWLFENCFPNTLDTTVDTGTLNGKPDTFVITGDIHAMWLRDSTAQVWPYLQLARNDKELKKLIAGVINRQVNCILIDPYANAFNLGPTGSEWAKDLTEMKPELHERKWEIDSLCYPVRLSWGYWKTTGDASVFDARWQEAMKLVVKTFREQQRMENPGPYSFQRVTSWQSDTVPLGGWGNPAKPVGLIHSMFRPSDDSCIYPFLIPSNLFASAVLEYLADIFASELNNAPFAAECRGFSSEVRKAVEKYAVGEYLDYGPVYSYEVDGFGNKLFIDDANVPSLLSLPYLGCCSLNDPVYLNTRRYILSTDNPYFFKGSAGEGIGGPHCGLEMIWPLSIIMRGLTSTDDGEIRHCLAMLKSTHAGTGFMHESFHRNNAEKFTRKWFAWANTLFGELILKIYNERPHLLSE